MAIRRYIDSAAIKRYIDVAVRRELRRIFRDSIVDDLRRLWKEVELNSSELGQARPSLKILIDMYERPKNVSPDILGKNKVHFAKLVQKAIEKSPSRSASVAKAGVVIRNLIPQIERESSAKWVGGSDVPTSGPNPYKAGEYKQYQLRENVHGSTPVKESTGERTSYMTRRNGMVTGFGVSKGKNDSMRRIKRYRKFDW